MNLQKTKEKKEKNLIFILQFINKQEQIPNGIEARLFQSHARKTICTYLGFNYICINNSSWGRLD